MGYDKIDGKILPALDDGYAEYMSNMRQIARLAGVSLSTVSRALHDSSRIPATTRERVIEVARQLNYTLPDQHTGRFPNGRVIGYIIHQRFGAIATDTLRGAMEEAWRHEFGITMMQVNSNLQWIEEAIANLLDMGISGLILAHAHPQSLPHRVLLALRSRGVHVVQIMIKKFVEPLDSVCRHEEKYAEIAAEHLAAFGHRQVLCVGARVNTWSPPLRAKGISVTCLNYPDGAPEEMTLAFEAFLTMHPRPTALIAGSVEFAYRLMNMALLNGLRVPEDLTIMGLGDMYESDRYPEITTIDTQAEEMGRTGVRLLADRMASGLPPHEIIDFQDIILPASIIDRGSTGPVLAE